MAIVCHSCGGYIVPIVHKEKNAITCTECNQESPMNILPLFIVTGASGVGKTTIVSELRTYLPDFDIFETDVMTDQDWQKQRNNWLRIAHSIAQNNRITVLCGTMMPEEIKKCDHYLFFKDVHFAILHCDDKSRETRLRSRPDWRKSSSDQFIEEHKNFAHWLIENANTAFSPPAPVVDTTFDTPDKSAKIIAKWIKNCINTN